MSANSQNLSPRKRKGPVRRTPAIIEQREQKPFVLGWGTGLDRHQREALKERIALFAGIGLAVVLALLLGWGWYQDNIAGPSATRAHNNQLVAIVGKDDIRLGLFTDVAKFEKKQLSGTLTQDQQQLASLQASPKKNAAAIAQINQQVSQIQQEQSLVPTITLNSLIQNDVMFQRAGSVGVKVTQKDINSQLRQDELAAGGVHVFQKSIQQSGLSHDEFMMITRGNILQKKLSAKLAKTVGHYQTKVRASHILIATKNHALALRLYNQVKAGANIAPLAKKYSIDKGSAVKGGNLGFATPTTYVAPFAKAVSSMKPGEVRLVKSQYGWHIIKLTGRERVKLTPNEYQQAQSQAFNNWMQTQQTKLHVQRIMDVTKLPGLASPTAVPGLPNALTPQVPTSGQSTGNSTGSAPPAAPGKPSTKK